MSYIMKVFMVDAACNSMPYDHSLCEALALKGCNVSFFGSLYTHTAWNISGSYKYKTHFYKFTNWIYRGKPRGFLRQYIKAVEHILNMAHFLYLVKKNRPDIIHFQWSQLPFIDRWYLKKLKFFSPLIFTMHNTTPMHGEKPSFYFLQKVDQSFLKYFDYFIVHTNYSREVATKTANINQDKILVVPHGLLNYYYNNSSPENVLEKYGLSNNEKIILFFGNISFYKGLDILIHAYAQLPSKAMRETRLLVVGRPNLDVSLIYDLAESLGVRDRIIFDLRFISEKEVSNIFSICSLIAMPYRHIDQSGVLMTVLNYGKPIVASNLGGFREIIEDQVHGRLVEPENPKDLASALNDILGSQKLIDEMGKSVKNLSLSWPTWEAIADKTINSYKLARKESVN